MSSVAENIIQHATHNSTLHQLAKDQPSVGVTTAFSILDTLKSMSYLKIFATLICILLVWDQVAYQIKKGSIAGPKFKFWPIIGPFLESLDPKFEEYKAKWASGPLSCVSIFHKFVVIASTRDLARKILQSSKFVKPCVVDVAVKILRPCNWVFFGR